MSCFGKSVGVWLQNTLLVIRQMQLSLTYFLETSRKEERRKGKSEEEKGGEEKKAMVALLVSIMATLEFLAANIMLDGRGPFGGNVLKNPARCTSATAFRIVHVRAKMVARVPHYDEKLFKLQDNKTRKTQKKIRREDICN